MQSGERQHDGERGKHESDPREDTAPISRALVAGEDAHLKRRGSRQRLNHGEALQEALLGEPLTPLLDFRLDQTPDRRDAEAEGADLEEHLEYLKAGLQLKPLLSANAPLQPAPWT
jgi:hypothetical protein